MRFKLPLISRKRFAVVAGTGVLALAAACGGDTPAAVPTDPAPTATTQVVSPTATQEPAAPTETPVTGAPTSTVAPTATTPRSTATTPAPTSTAIPSATLTPVPPTPVPPTPTATPVVTFTPGIVNTVELSAAKDNTLFESQVGATSNGAGLGLFAGKTNNNLLRRALIQFNVASAVPPGSTIESVELKMSVTRTVTQVESFTLHRVTSDWGEGPSDAAANEGSGAMAQPGDVTWIHTFSPDQMWQTPGGDFVATDSSQVNAQGNGVVIWSTTESLVADVQAWVEDPSSNFGWMLRGDEVNQKSAKRFGSRENPDESVRPKLTIRFTPPA